MTDKPTGQDAAQWKAELSQLQARLATLETRSATGHRKGHKGRLIGVCGALAILGAGLWTHTVHSQSCGQTLPAPLVTFCAGGAAQASTVNGNFQTIVNWIDQKVGSVGSSQVTVTGGNLVVEGGRIMVDDSTSNYDVWIQGSTTNTAGGDGRNLALLGLSQTGGDQLIVNYNGEYGGGTVVGSDLSVQGDLAVAGQSLGCYTRWGQHGCASGYTEVVRGHSGGQESYHNTNGANYNNVECVSDSASVLTTWTGTSYATRMMRANADGNGMQGVPNRCSQCCRGGCYTALGTNSCAAGYTRVYEGRTGGIEAFEGQRPELKTLCVDVTASTQFTWSTGYNTRLMRHREMNGGNSESMEEVTNSCAVCCN